MSYLELPDKSLIAADMIHVAGTLPPEAWVEYYNFMASPVPPHFLLLDPTLSKLSEKREFRGGILKMEPNSCYNWHTDTKRKVSINMLLGGFDSHCLFATDKVSINMGTKELKYRPRTYYVFDTQTPHMVINFDEPRYLFSIEFVGKDEDLTFSELCADFEG